MKQHLALLCFLGLALPASVLAAEANSIPNFLRQDEASIAQAYSPFGNRMQFNRFGDDGSSCVLDASGVLTWIDSTGTVHLLPNSDKAVPLFVTNTECLVWTNRFVDYEDYSTRPVATLTLFRATPGNSVVTATPVNGSFFGKEVLATPPVTTTTGTLNFVTTTRTTTTSVNDLTYDQCDMRVYRLTAAGTVQFIKSLQIKVRNAGAATTNVDGSDVSTIGSSSDGSLIVSSKNSWTSDTAPSEVQNYWIDGEGRVVNLIEKAAGEKVTRVLYTSNTRVVYEGLTGAPSIAAFREQSRSATTGDLIAAKTVAVTAVVPAAALLVSGSSLELSNYTKSGELQYFSTLDTTGLKLLTYKVVDTGATLIRTTTLSNAISLTTAADAVNLADGSALISAPNSVGIFWQHAPIPSTLAPATPSLTSSSLIPNSILAKGLYVTDTQAVIWENARAPLAGDGKIPPAVVTHYSRDAATNVLTSTRIYVDGTTLLNTLRLSPDVDYWTLSTAEKMSPVTSLLRNYRLASLSTSDKDQDGILDQAETNTGIYVSQTDTGTNPNDPDSDDDGLNDGAEIFPFQVVEGNFTWEQAKADAYAKGGFLATVTSSTELDGLKRQLRGRNTFSFWLGATDSVAEGTFAWVNRKSASLFQAPVEPFTWAPLVTPWAPGKPDNVQNADGLLLSTDFQWRDAPLSELHGYVIEYPSSSALVADTDGDTLNDAAERASGGDPNVADGDGDGLNDAAEVVHGTNPLLADTDGDGLSDGAEVTLGTNPTLADTDGDGLSDGAEVALGTKPLLADTDGDGLSDGAEIYGVGGFTSDPLLVDTDGDGYDDFKEMDAKPPTNPRDPASHSIPGVTQGAGLNHNVPVTYREPATVTIGDTFAPFGQRPDTDKIGDDGSVAVRDRNGVILWIDSLNNASVLPNSSLAKTLYVSNTECVVYNNRYASDYNVWGSNSEIIIYRRNSDGTIKAAPTITVRGTVLETSKITPTSYGFSFVAAYGWNFSTDESSRTLFTGIQNGVEIYTNSSFDQWHNTNYQMYRVTWDAAVQNLGFFTVDVEKTNTNLGGTVILGNSDDGSMVFTTRVAGSYLYSERPSSPAFFYTVPATLWATWQINNESITQFESQSGVVREAAYISNSRVLLANGDTSGAQWISDFRMGTDGNPLFVGRGDLVSGEQMLPLGSYTRSALPPYVYTTDASGTSLKLYLYGDTFQPLGTPVILPAPVVSGSAFVRNPRDASLLIKSNGSAGVLWIPTVSDATTNAVIGLGAVKSIPKSTLGLPMFVNSAEAVVWMNNGASVDLGLAGMLPKAEISHFSAAGSALVTKVLTPPIIGRYVALPSPLSQDPNTEGWYINTFEKTSPRAARVLSYKLLEQDSDNDGLGDSLELSYGTDPRNPDTDGDKINDGREVKLGTNPLKKDSDGDGLSDFAEVNDYKTNPISRDSDADGVSDGGEVKAGTNPLKFNELDSDHDGVSDKDEIKVTHTDPKTPSFGKSGASSAVPFGNSTVSTTYEGIVFDSNANPSFEQNLRLSADGSFSSGLLGLRSDASFRGSFSDKGSFKGVPGNSGGLVSVQMSLVKQSKGVYYVQGSYETRTGGTLYFQLRPVSYSSAKPYKNAGKVTFEASLSASDSGPSGTAVATGGISASGQVSFNIYLPDGSRSSYSGPIVDGGLVALYSRSSSAGRPVLVGSLKLEDIKGQSDFDGNVRLFSAVGATASLFPSGYDQSRSLKGSRYYPPATGTLPLSSFDVSANNAVFNWLGGSFAGEQKVGTWSTDSRMTIPATQFDRSKASFNPSTGLLLLNYTLTDATLNLNNVQAKASAVVVQKNSTFRGSYLSGLSAAAFTVEPNTGGLKPEITSVSPKNKSVSAAATTYTVTVGTTGAWNVSIPKTTPWITATVSSVGSTSTKSGSGNGTVTIKVAVNPTYVRREAEITIAGFKHTITQDFR